MEILVVITITIILMGLIFGPIIQTFNMTRRATAMVQAQDTARTTLELISRELSQAMFVYDNSNSPINFPVAHASGATTNIEALYGKIDMILPKMVMHCNDPNHPSGQPRDYERGDEAWPFCPYCNSDNIEARPKQPLSADGKIVRYFIGLADPDPTNTSFPTPGFRDWPEVGAPMNGFILYRAEFDPYDLNLIKQDSDGMPILDDPHFFYSTDTAPNSEPYWKNWKAIARPVGPQVDTDLVVVQLNDAENEVIGLTPSVKFQPTQMTNDTFTPAHITDEAAEAPTSIPTVFRATYGAWASSIGDYTRDIYNVTVIRQTKTATEWYRTVWEPNNHLVIYKYDNNGSTRVFDITNYEARGAVGPLTIPPLMYTVDPVRGEVRFDFPASYTINMPNIEAMNKTIRDHWASGSGVPVRMKRISLFAHITPTSQYQPRIVPGSEVVIGPDMTPGLPQSQIRMVRYERVPFNLGDPGRNQYKIDYGMDDTTGERVGRIFFSPAYDEVIPERNQDGPSYIDISYKWQCNRDNDIVIGNYATKTLIQVTLGIRYYDRNSGKLTPMELTNKVQVRNLMR